MSFFESAKYSARLEEICVFERTEKSARLNVNLLDMCIFCASQIVCET